MDAARDLLVDEIESLRSREFAELEAVVGVAQDHPSTVPGVALRSTVEAEGEGVLRITLLASWTTDGVPQSLPMVMYRGDATW